MSDFIHDIIANVDEKLLCPKCRKILKAPKQTDCGHRYCRICIDDLCRDGKGTCLIADCKEDIDASECFSDRAIQKEINNLKVECPYKTTGCGWKGKYKDLEDHLKDCKGEQLCIDCNEKVKVINIEEHRTSSCSNKRIPCVFEHFGCTFRPTVEDKERHIEAEWFDHLKLVLLFLLSIKNFSNANTLHVTGRAKNPELDGAIGGAETAANPEKKESKTPKKQNDAIIVKRVETLEGIISVLHNEVENMFTKFDEQAHSKSHLEEIKRFREEIRLKDATIASLSLKIDELKQTSYDRRLIWKIVNCRQKMEDAKSRRVVSIFSTPFYTEKNGYKMCGRIYLNGDGMGKGTHVSLFFVVCKGENDAILSWPFRQKVTFTMISQNKKEHIIDAFRTDPSSSSFKKPVAEMNTASGCPLFASLSDVLNPETGYIKDDTMYIKIAVEGDNGMIA